MANEAGDEQIARPTDAATLERAVSLVNEGLFTVVLQRRRLQTSEPEDDYFLFRKWADWQFLIVALTRVRRAAEIATNVDGAGTAVRKAIAAFDAALPALRVMRNVAEHIDDYAVESGRRHHRWVTRRGLQVGEWDDTRIVWHLDGPHVLDANRALAAAEELLSAVRDAHDTLARRQR